jgi:hypothetical protein
MKLVKIRKLKDNKFGGNHPNYINEGYETRGYETNPPNVGDRYLVSGSIPEYSLITSVVKKIKTLKDGYKLTTENSVYEVKFINNNNKDGI